MGGMRMGSALGVMVLTLQLQGCGSHSNLPRPLTISAPDISGGKLAPALTCDGAGRSPAISWSTPHPATNSVVIELIDSDVPQGKSVQWLVYGDGQDPGSGTLPSPPSAEFQKGTNDLGKLGYTAPCPPHGTMHHYRLLVRAIGIPMQPGGGGGELPPGYTSAQLEAGIHHQGEVDVMNQGEIDATYTRP
jgi:phosphatidylethanolamine-binding protein (PEBP) family uncharacterized protein